MAANRRVGGLLFVKVNGQLLQAKGAFDYNFGVDKKEAVVGADGVHGFMQKPQVPFVEGSITDSDELDVQTLFETRDATVTLELANGKVFVLEEAWFAGDGQGNTEEGEISVRFEGIRGREIA
jgi:hypothetical protein